MDALLNSTQQVPVARTINHNNCEIQEQCNFSGYEISSLDRKKLDHMGDLFFKNGLPCLLQHGLTDQELIPFKKLLDRYCQKAISGDAFCCINQDEVCVINKFHMPAQAATTNNGESPEILPIFSQDQAGGETEEARNADTRKDKLPIPDQTPEYIETIKNPEDFESLSVDQQVKVLTKIEDYQSSTYLEYCSAAQRAEISKHPEFPKKCILSMNLRLLEDTIQKAIDARHDLRIPAKKSVVEKAQRVFYQDVISEEFLSFPNAAHDLFRNIVKSAQLLPESTLKKLIKIRYSYPRFEDLRYAMSDEILKAKKSMALDQRDIFSVSMRIMKYVYEKSPDKPMKNTESNPLTSKQDVANLYMMNLFDKLPSEHGLEEPDIKWEMHQRVSTMLQMLTLPTTVFAFSNPV